MTTAIRFAATVAAIFLSFTAARAADPAVKCESGKLKESSKYSACRLKADAKGVSKGIAADYTKCETKLTAKWAKTETKFGAECPTLGDVADIQSQMTADSDFVALKLAGDRFVDNGDGTVTDTQTGLTWEQKNDLGGNHDWDTIRTWCTTCTGSYRPDGTAFVNFLGQLNEGVSSDGETTAGCFAGYCDWRLPTIDELTTILDCSFGNPCIDPIFGLTKSAVYWSSSTFDGAPDNAWVVFFDGDGTAASLKSFGGYVRAVRGGS